MLDQVRWLHGKMASKGIILKNVFDDNERITPVTLTSNDQFDSVYVFI